MMNERAELLLQNHILNMTALHDPYSEMVNVLASMLHILHTINVLVKYNHNYESWNKMHALGTCERI